MKKMAYPVTNTDLANFAEKLIAMLAAHHQTAKNVGNAPTIQIQPGQRYARLALVDGMHGGLSAYCFVDLTNGDLLKAAGWKAPAKGKRGSIFADNPLSGCTPYGMAYAR